jgi:hypothetical protein
MILAHQYAEQYALSGRATITLVNSITRNEFSYNIRQIKDMLAQPVRVWHVYHNKKYIGYINKTLYFILGADIPIELKTSQAVKVFAWAWERIHCNTVPKNIVILRSEYCGRCGRKLTEPISILSGIGPFCRKEMGIDDAQYKKQLYNQQINNDANNK